MQGKIGWWRTLLAVGVVLFFGLMGFACTNDFGSTERFTQFQTVITPDDVPAIDVDETIDFDSGGRSRHGIFRLIPTDFGMPEQLTVSAENAPDDLDVSRLGSDVKVRIGDPDITFNGQRRYHVSYRLPNAQYSVGSKLAVDLFGNLDFKVDTVRGVLAGFELSSTECFVGPAGSNNTCDLMETAPGVYEVRLEDVDQGDFVSIGGTVERLVTPPAITIDPMPVAEKRPPFNWLKAGAPALAAALAIIATYVWGRIRGANTIYGTGGATTAAFPTGNESAPMSTRVSDAELKELAGTEFAPPSGVAPWEGGVLITEVFDKSVMQNYVSGLIGSGVIEAQQDPTPGPFGLGSLLNPLTLSVGPNYANASPEDREWVDRVFALKYPYELGKYDPEFARIMRATRRRLYNQLKQRRWWRRGLRRWRVTPGSSTIFMVIFVGFFLAIGLPVLLITLSIAGVFWQPWTWMALAAAAFILALITARLMYAPLFPSRTAEGSAVALKTESFRRFLHHSEGQHVEWAWKNGHLREYSAWAVALGEANAWSRALQFAQVPPQPMSATPMLMGRVGPTLSSSTTRPGTRGRGGSGGGFSGGGSAGGGGGGGGGGSW